MLIVRIIFPCVLTILLAGCVTSVKHVTCEDEVGVHHSSVPVYVVDHGWHVGISFPVDAVAPRYCGGWLYCSDANYVEIGWGDAEYYPSEEDGFVLAMRALLLPTASVIHRTAFNEHVTEYFLRADNINGFTLSSQGFQKMLQWIDKQVARDAKGQPIPVARGLYGKSMFYASHRTFSLAYTCHAWVADALRASGCPVSTTVASAF